MKTRNNKNPGVPAIALEGEKALKAAVAEVVAEHRKTRKPLAVWYDGKAVMMSPDKALAVVREDHPSYGAKRK